MMRIGRSSLRRIVCLVLGLLVSGGLPAVRGEGRAARRADAGTRLEAPGDAFLHGTAGAGLVLLAAAAASCAVRGEGGDVTRAVYLPPAVGLGTAVAAAAGKELLDLAGFGRAQGSDFLASVFGGATASAAALFLCGLARQADLDPRVVPLVLGTMGVGLTIPAAEIFAQRAWRLTHGRGKPAAAVAPAGP